MLSRVSLYFRLKSRGFLPHLLKIFLHKIQHQILKIQKTVLTDYNDLFKTDAHIFLFLMALQLFKILIFG